jgi:hypothetical protein
MRNGTRSEAPLPNFLIIGAQKGATRWLRTNLNEHPEVFAPEGEPSFFDTYRFESGLESYRATFEGWNGERYVGEATPSYMMPRRRPERVARRIDSSLPGVRLFAILRDPVDRTYSAYVHHVKRGRIPANVGLLEYLDGLPPERDRLSLIAGSWYATGLTPYVRRFGDRLLVLSTEQARTEPEDVYRVALEHLGAGSDFLPRQLRRIRYSNTLPARTSTDDAASRPRPSVEERAYIYDLVRDEIGMLEDLLGRSFDSWRQKRGAA